VCHCPSGPGEGMVADAFLQESNGPGKNLVLLLEGGDQRLAARVCRGFQRTENLTTWTIDVLPLYTRRRGGGKQGRQ
jgi:hypothetical protein